MYGYHTACDRVYMLFIVQRAIWTRNNETSELIHMCTCTNTCMPEDISQAEENVCHPPPGSESLPMYTHTQNAYFQSVLGASIHHMRAAHKYNYPSHPPTNTHDNSLMQTISAIADACKIYINPWVPAIRHTYVALVCIYVYLLLDAFRARL